MLKINRVPYSVYKSSDNGPQGAVGPQGPQGPQGAVGPPGLNVSPTPIFWVAQTDIVLSQASGVSSYVTNMTDTTNNFPFCTSLTGEILFATTGVFRNGSTDTYFRVDINIEVRAPLGDALFNMPVILEVDTTTGPILTTFYNSTTTGFAGAASTYFVNYSFSYVTKIEAGKTCRISTQCSTANGNPYDVAIGSQFTGQQIIGS